MHAYLHPLRRLRSLLLSLFEFTVKANKSRELEDRIERFVRELRTPVPRGSHSAVNAAPSLLKIITTTSVER